MKIKRTKKPHTTKRDNAELDDMLPEYDFDYSKAKPNRFAERAEENLHNANLQFVGIIQQARQELRNGKKLSLEEMEREFAHEQNQIGVLRKRRRVAPGHRR